MNKKALLMVLKIWLIVITTLLFAFILAISIHPIFLLIFPIFTFVSFLIYHGVDTGTL